MEQTKPWILFVAEPEYSLPEYVKLQGQFNTVEYVLKRDSDGTAKEAFLKFLEEHAKKKGPIVGIFGGYPQFAPLGGLNADLLQDPRWPDSVKCICLCSVGYNGIDLELLQQKQIMLFNYDDCINDGGIVANDVADCVLWHVLDGFRKFSSQMNALRVAKDTIQARSDIVLGKDRSQQTGSRFQFGHRWKHDSYVETCRGKKCLIMGLGRIGISCGVKLESALGMEIHYAQRNRSTSEAAAKWQFHAINTLSQRDPSAATSTQQNLPFDCIVVCLPGNASTFHLIDQTFLNKLKSGIVLCNVGRGSIIDMEAVQKTMVAEPDRIRHVALDVFHDEPAVEASLAEDLDHVTITPHIASSSRAVWEASNRLAMQVLSHVCDPAYVKEIDTSNLPRVV